MQKRYRVIFECYDAKRPKKALSQHVVLDESIETPTNCLDFSMGFDNQILLIQNVQDHVLSEKVAAINADNEQCPCCDNNLMKFGMQHSKFHDVLTDHDVKMQRLKCNTCKYELPSTVKLLISGSISGELSRIQATLGSEHSYRASEKILSLFSTKERQVNNHDRVKQVVESVGGAVETLNEEEKEILTAEEAPELVLNVDGGHIKTTEDKRSMEAIISVIYRPEAIQSNAAGTRNYLTSKNCAASVKDDKQGHIKSSTIIAALKQGLTYKTHVTALCDGAENCWSVVEALSPLCGSMTRILDWFHLTMKIENISLPNDLKDKLTKIKWHLWRGNVDRAQVRLRQLQVLAKDEKNSDKLMRFSQYINSNKDRIVNYRERKMKGLVFTSNLAESTVESLINQRCKGKQHMRWSRSGLNPLLQLRAAIQSNDWTNKWKSAILSARSN